MKDRTGKSRSRSMSGKKVRLPVRVAEGSVVGGWSGVQRSASRNLSAGEYLQQVRAAIEHRSCDGQTAYEEFTGLVEELRSSPGGMSSEKKMVTIERLIGLLEGHPRLILNLTIFLPDEYFIEVQRDAVVIKIFESENSLGAVDTGNSRSMDNTPRSSWAWMGRGTSTNLVDRRSPRTPRRDRKAGIETKRRSPERTRRKSASPKRRSSSTASMPNSKGPVSRSQTQSRTSSAALSLELRSPRRKTQSKRRVSPVNRNDVYLLEENAASTDTSTLDYIRTIKKKYGKHPEVYKRFMEVLKDLHSGALEDVGAISEIVSLFKAHPLLVLGFSEFLPKGRRIVQVKKDDAAPHRSNFALELSDKNGQTIRQEIIT